MTGTDWLDHLEKAATTATPGAWAADIRMDGRAWIDMPGTDGHAIALHGRHADAVFIAAANPHTVQRLIEDNRRLRHQIETDSDVIALFRDERDALAAKVARIVAVLDDAPHTDVFTLDAAIRNALNGSTR